MLAVPFKIFAGSASQGLAKNLARELNVTLCKSTHYPLPNGEPYVELNACVEGADVYLIQSLITPASWHLLELILMADAAKRSGAKRIQAIIPYYSYGRQDRADSPGQPLGAKCVAKLLEASGIEKVTILNAHSPQLSAWFDIPVVELSSLTLFAQAIKERDTGSSIRFLAADAGALKIALEYTQLMPRTGDPAVILKHRENAYQVSAKGLVGDLKDKDVWIVDDCVQTGQTLAQATHLAREHGAKSVSAAIVHMDICQDALAALKHLDLKHLLTTSSCENPLIQELQPQIIPIETVLKAYLTSCLSSNGLYNKNF